MNYDLSFHFCDSLSCGKASLWPGERLKFHSSSAYLAKSEGDKVSLIRHQK